MENQETPRPGATQLEIAEYAASMLHLIIAASRQHPPVGDVNVTTLVEHSPGKTEGTVSGGLTFSESSGQFRISVGSNDSYYTFSLPEIQGVLPQGETVFIETMAFFNRGHKTQLIRISNRK